MKKITILVVSATVALVGWYVFKTDQAPKPEAAQLGKAIGSLHVVADASVSVNAKVSAHTI